MLGLPGKDVQRQVSLRAPVRERTAGFAVNMDLPIRAGERRKIVGAVERHPGQAVAALHASGRAAAQRAAAVIDHGLRHRTEREAARRPRI